MQGSILIFGGSSASRTHKIDEIASAVTETEFNFEDNPNNPDIKIVNAPKGKSAISIDEVKEGIKFLSEKPFSHKYKILIFPNAQQIQPRAQNLFLKTLEEPPKWATIILCAKTEGDLLETVISRCQKISVKNGTNNGNDKTEWLKLKSLDIGKRMEWAEKTAKEERLDAVKLLEEWLDQERHILIENRNVLVKESSANIKFLQEAIKNMGTNTNARLILESLALHII